MTKKLISKTIKSAGIAGMGAFLLYLTQFAAGMDYGIYTPLVTGLLSVAVNFVRELKKANGEPQE